MTPFDNNQLISRARAHLLLDSKPSAAFLATLAMQLRLIPSEQVPTLQTDGTSLWWNPTFAASLPSAQLQFVVAHEVLHCGLLHCYRRGSRDAELYNIAADYVVNLQLTEWGFEPPPNIYCDKQYRGLSVEAVYAKLALAKSQAAPPDPGQGNPQPGSGDASQGVGAGKPAPNGQNTPQPVQGKGYSGKNAQNGVLGPQGASGSPGEGNPGPDSRDATGEPRTAGNGVIGAGPKPPILPGCPTGDFTDPAPGAQAEDADGNPGPPPMTAEDWAIVVEQANLAAQAAGTMPGGTDGLLKASRKPANDWKNELKQYITQSISSEQSWSRPNRRFLGSGLILPGAVKESIGEIVVFVDTSGSTRGPMLQAFSDELSLILGEVGPERTHVVYADTGVRRVDVFERGDEFELHSAGGGGTLFQPVLDWVEEQSITPLVGIWLTDLACFDKPLSPSFPVIWATPNFIDRQPPFEGAAVKIDVV